MSQLCGSALDSVVECGEDRCCCAYGTDCCLFVCLRPSHHRRIVFALYPRGVREQGGHSRDLKAVDVGDLVEYATSRASRLILVGEELQRRILRDLRRGRLGYVEVGMEAVTELIQKFGNSGGGASDASTMGVFEVVVQSLTHALLSSYTVPRAITSGARAARLFAARQNYLLDQYKLRPLGVDLLETVRRVPMQCSGDLREAQLEALGALAEVLLRSDASALRDYAADTVSTLGELLRNACTEGGSLLWWTTQCLRCLAASADLATSPILHSAALRLVQKWRWQPAHVCVALLRAVDSTNPVSAAIVREKAVIVEKRLGGIGVPGLNTRGRHDSSTRRIDSRPLSGAAQPLAASVSRAAATAADDTDAKLRCRALAVAATIVRESGVPAGAYGAALTAPAVFTLLAPGEGEGAPDVQMLLDPRWNKLGPDWTDW